MNIRMCMFVILSIILCNSAFSSEVKGHLHNKLIGSDVVYTKDDIDNILSNYEISQTNRYPMFLIPLNSIVYNDAKITEDENGDTHVSFGQSKTKFMSYELKASTNNFDVSIPLDTTNKRLGRMTYWEASNHTPNRFQTGTSLMTFSCDAHTRRNSDSDWDNRAWVRFDIGNERIQDKCPLYVIAIIDPDKFQYTKINPNKSKDWLCASNSSEIVWSYIRYDANSPESDDRGFYIWHPIAPIAWLPKLPSWATNGINKIEKVYVERLSFSKK